MDDEFAPQIAEMEMSLASVRWCRASADKLAKELSKKKLTVKRRDMLLSIVRHLSLKIAWEKKMLERMCEN